MSKSGPEFESSVINEENCIVPVGSIIDYKKIVFQTSDAGLEKFETVEKFAEYLKRK